MLVRIFVTVSSLHRNIFLNENDFLYPISYATNWAAAFSIWIFLSYFRSDPVYPQQLAVNTIINFSMDGASLRSLIVVFQMWMYVDNEEIYSSQG